MTDKTTTALTAASALDGTELVPITQGGNNRKGLVSAIRTYQLGAANTWTALNTYSAGISIASGQTLNWNSDLYLHRDAANALALRNETNAQKFYIYNTYTDASNYERFRFEWSSNLFLIGQQFSGSGVARTMVIGAGIGVQDTYIDARDIIFRTSVGTNWQMTAAGHFLAASDNAFDIGASGATSPRNIYVGTSYFVGSTKVLGTQGATVADASGGAIIDAEARTALNALLARVRTHGLIAT